MPDASSYFCWIKLTPTTATSGPAAAPPVLTDKTVARTVLMGWLSDQMQADLKPLEPDRPPRAAAMQAPAWWQLDKQYGSTANANVDLAPVFGDAEAAVKWIGSGFGKQWLVGASHHFLLTFHHSNA